MTKSTIPEFFLELANDRY